MAAYTPLHEHSELFDFILDRYLDTEELLIYRYFKGQSQTTPWLQISVTRATLDCDDALLFVHKPVYPSPRLPTRVRECTPTKLVLKGSMIYHHPDRADKFLLTFRKNDSKDSIWWTGLLEIDGYPSITLYVYRDHNSIREYVYLPFNYGDPSIKKGDPILYRPTNDDESILGSFAGWQSSVSNQLKLTVAQTVRHPSVKSCLAVFARPHVPRALEDEDSSSSSSEDLVSSFKTRMLIN